MTIKLLLNRKLSVFMVFVFLIYVLMFIAIQLHILVCKPVEQGQNAHVMCENVIVNFDKEKLENNMWHKIQSKVNQLEIRFAHMYYDDRHSGGPIITTHTVVNTTKLEDIPIYCTLWIDHDYEPIVFSTKAHRVLKTDGGQSFKIDNIPMFQYVISCKVPHGQHVVAATLSFCMCQRQVSSKIPVQYYYSPSSVKTYNKSDLLICIPPLYADFMESEQELMAFVEWIEIYRLLGVQRFVMYNVSMTPNQEFTRIVQYYQDIVKLIQFPPPFVYTNWMPQLYQATKLTVSSVLADCILRYKSTFNYILIVDVDDVVFPKRHKNLTTYLRLQHNSKSWHSLKVYKKDFFLNYPAKNSADPLITSRYIYYAPDSFGWNFKSFINTMTCEVPYEHECRLSIGKTKYARAPKEDLEVHHYRRSCFSTHQISNKGKTNYRHLPEKEIEKCRENLKNVSLTDSTGTKYRKPLLKSIRKTLQDLQLSGKTY